MATRCCIGALQRSDVGQSDPEQAPRDDAAGVFQLARAVPTASQLPSVVDESVRRARKREGLWWRRPASGLPQTPERTECPRRVPLLRVRAWRPLWTRPQGPAQAASVERVVTQNHAREPPETPPPLACRGAAMAALASATPVRTERNAPMAGGGSDNGRSVTTPPTCRLSVSACGPGRGSWQLRRRACRYAVSDWPHSAQKRWSAATPAPQPGQNRWPRRPGVAGPWEEADPVPAAGWPFVRSKRPTAAEITASAASTSGTVPTACDDRTRRSGSRGPRRCRHRRHRRARCARYLGALGALGTPGATLSSSDAFSYDTCTPTR